MKKITIVIAVCTIALTACKKDNKYFMSANIDGTSFYVDSTDGIYLAKFHTAPSLIDIAALLKNSNWGFRLEVVGYTGKGNYDLKSSGDRVSYYEADGGQWGVSSVSLPSATMTITSDSKNVVQGTFSFDVKCAGGCDSGAVKHITNGKFRLPVIYQ